MTEFSLEPPRRHLVVHHTFDNVELDRVVDSSPQSTDGKIVGDVTFGHTGVVGEAARFSSEDADVDITAATDYYPAPTTTVTGWGRSERVVSSSETNVTADLTIDGTHHALSHSESSDVSSWQYAAVEYDGAVARLYYAVRGDQRVEVVDTVDVSGTDVEAVTLSFKSNGYGFVDDARMYRRSIDRPYVRDLYEMGVDHAQRRNLKQAWENDGIPFLGSNVRLAGALSEQKSAYFRDLDAVREARHVKDAAGEQLGRIGRGYGVQRETGEDDPTYRARIIGELAAGRSDGTFEDVLEAAATIVDTSSDRITLSTQFDTDPGTVFVNVQSSDLDDSELSTSSLSDMLDRSVPAGHKVSVVEVGADPFTLTDDATANDSSLGLTSDSTTDGGTLVSDA